MIALCFFINLANIWCLYVLWTIFEVNWTLQHQCFLGRGQRQFSRSQILIMGPVWKISQWNLASLLHKYSETSKPNFRGNIQFLLVLWPLEVYSNSLCRQSAPVCPAMGEIRYNTTGNPWQNEKLLQMHQNQANLFENMHFHRHWSSQLRTVNVVSVWI